MALIIISLKYSFLWARMKIRQPTETRPNDPECKTKMAPNSIDFFACHARPANQRPPTPTLPFNSIAHYTTSLPASSSMFLILIFCQSIILRVYSISARKLHENYHIISIPKAGSRMRNRPLIYASLCLAESGYDKREIHLNRIDIRQRGFTV